MQLSKWSRKLSRASRLAGLSLLVQLDVLTQHDDSYRTGTNLRKTVLARANVGQVKFESLFDPAHDNEVYIHSRWLMDYEVIALDCDALGKQTTPVSSGDPEAWFKPLAHGSVVVGVVNQGASEFTAIVKASHRGLSAPVKFARDLRAHASSVLHNGIYTAKIRAMSCSWYG